MDRVPPRETGSSLSSECNNETPAGWKCIRADADHAPQDCALIEVASTEREQAAAVSLRELGS